MAFAFVAAISIIPFTAEGIVLCFADVNDERVPDVEGDLQTTNFFT